MNILCDEVRPVKKATNNMDILDDLITTSCAPTSAEEFSDWLLFKDAFDFIKANLKHDEFIVYAGLTHTFLHAITVPQSLLNPPDIDDLMQWNCNASSGWGISHTFSDPPQVWIAPPLEHTGSKTLDQGEQLVFARFFEGRLGKKSYFEVLQKFTHIFDLHFIEERSAYCRIEELGDIEDVIRIINLPGRGEAFDGSVVTFKRSVLNQYLALTDSAIVRTFDFTRFRPDSFGGWSQKEATQKAEGDLFYRSVVEPGHASYARGCQIVRPTITKDDAVKEMEHGEKEDRQYASFIVHDWKNNTIAEVSSAPGETANYFTQSELPYEMSSVFFRPEVLLKYKADSEKYELINRSITCRGAWNLQTYDVNEAGQVHTYLVYLRRLPYREQLHWKAYNEAPKASISKRAFKSDFLGEWDAEYDPLDSMKSKLRSLHRQQVPWWRLRSERLIDAVHYPATSSPDEWSNEILQLDQLLIEGFEKRWLRDQAKSLGRTPPPEFGSVKMLGECLIGYGFDEDDALGVTRPFHIVHTLRSKLKGHASGEEAVKIKKEILREHGSYKNHFSSLVSQCDDSMKQIIETLSAEKTPIATDE